MKKKTSEELFFELAKPDENFVSRWVKVEEFVGEYKSLQFGNGAGWARNDGPFGRKYNVEKKTDITPGNRVDAIRINGLRNEKTFSQAIRKDIKDFYRDKNCVMLGVNGKSANTLIEIDHKDGRKDDWRVSEKETQKIEDFQPLCKAANDIKRQICKVCKATDKRWDAKNIKGNPYSFYKGDENYNEQLGCEGCYQFDPVEYRKESVKKIAKETVENTTDFIMKKLYGENEK